MEEAGSSCCFTLLCTIVVTLVTLVLSSWALLDCDIITFIAHIVRKQWFPKCMLGKRVWIIGASSGLGESLAYKAVEEGASLLVLSSRRESELERVQKECLRRGAKSVLLCPLDITAIEECANSMKSFMTEFLCNSLSESNEDSSLKNGINNDDQSNGEFFDEVIVNAGVSYRGRVMHTSLSVFRRLMEVNFLGVLACVRNIIAFRRQLKINKNGRTRLRSLNVTFTSSLAGRVSSPVGAAYSASKHALMGLIDAMRAECSSERISFSVVCPGLFQIDPTHSTPGLGSKLGEPSGRLDHYQKGLSLDRVTELYLSVVHFKLSESWIGGFPNLFFVNIQRYFPVLFEYLITFLIGPSMIAKMLGDAPSQTSYQFDE